MKRLGFTVTLLATVLSSFAAVPGPAGLGDALRPQADEEAAFVLNATGVQVYACKAKASQAYAYEWTFVGPEASLSEGGAVVGRHYAGPTWETSSGASSVKGAMKQKQDGGAGNIPWLMLAATPSGDGKFSGVTTILRVNTKGGFEPSGGCDEFKVGQQSRVPYTADYYFYKKK